jgi:hypothetical protein
MCQLLGGASFATDTPPDAYLQGCRVCRYRSSKYRLGIPQKKISLHSYEYILSVSLKASRALFLILAMRGNLENATVA